MTDTDPSPPRRQILKPLLFILAVIALPVVIFFGFRSLKTVYEMSACKTNLQQIAQAMSQYAADHHGEYPPSLRTILMNEKISSSAFVCPATAQAPATGPTTRDTADNLSADHISYTYLGGRFSPSTVKPTDVLAYEPLSNHVTGLHVLYGDGHVGWIPLDQADAFLETMRPRR